MPDKLRPLFLDLSAIQSVGKVDPFLGSLKQMLEAQNVDETAVEVRGEENHDVEKSCSGPTAPASLCFLSIHLHRLRKRNDRD